LVLVFSLVACNKENENIETPGLEENNGEDTNGEDTKLPEEDNNEEEEKRLVKVYFANSKYIETGDESITKLESEEREITPSENILEDIYKELIKGPEDSDKLSTVIMDNVTLKDAYIEDKIAYMDFKSEELSGGSLEETFFVDQIVASLLELEEVDKVQFLVDGEIASSLMGHVYIEEPFDSIQN
ncbi:MAG TPA: GerMN domain-containing protein, partial [Tissierellaceae bacterium]